MYTAVTVYARQELRQIVARKCCLLAVYAVFTARYYAMRKRGLCCRTVSVCPSVRLSDTLVYCIQMSEYIDKLLPRHGSAVTLGFIPRAPITQFQGEPL